MNDVMCPQCGRRLCKGDVGTKVEPECPKCGKSVTIIIGDDELYISFKPLKIVSFNHNTL